MLNSGSAIINTMIKACNKAAKSIARDLIEIEKLQSSPTSLNNFIFNSDIKAEKVIMQELQAARPEFDMLLEESGNLISDLKPKDPTQKKYRWIVDPIDGSSNFSHAHPNFAISIALECVEDPASANKVKKTRLGLSGYSDILEENYDPIRNIIAGVVYLPISRDTYWAEKGQGAYHINENGIQTRLKIGIRTRYEDLVIGTHFCHNTSKNYHKLYKTLFDKMVKTRISGTVALDCCFVASGKLDLSLYDRAMLWDIAAGAVIIKEAGGGYYFLKDSRKFQSSNTTKTVIFGNQALLDIILNVLQNT